MVEFPEDQFVQLESAVEGIEVFRPNSAEWRLPTTSDTLPNLSPVTEATTPDSINLSRLSAITIVAIPLLLAMAVMLWQEFFQRSDLLSVTGIATGLFTLGVGLALFFTYRALRGANG